jgi:hypothetical protein
VKLQNGRQPAELDCFCCLAAWQLGCFTALIALNAWAVFSALLPYCHTGFTASMALAGLGCLGCLESLCFVLDESSATWLEDL